MDVQSYKQSTSFLDEQTQVYKAKNVNDERIADDNFCNKLRQRNIDETLEPLALVKDRPSYGDLIWNTNIPLRGILTRFRDAIFTITFIHLYECLINPDKLTELANLWSEQLHGLTSPGIFFILQYLLTYLYIWAVLKIIDSVAILTALSFPVLTMMAWLPFYTLLTQPLGFAPRVIITFQQMIVFMKIWSLIAADKSKPISDQSTVSQAIYFFFAPTFIFQKNYPVRKEAKPLQGLKYLLKFCFYQLHLSLAVINFERPVTVKFITTLVKEERIDLSMFFVECVFWAYYIVITWISVFHFWLNAWSVFLNYGDRLYYEDWWSSESFGSFLRKWNRPVYGFLRTHINSPLKKRFPKSLMPKAITLLISVIFHDYLCLAIAHKIPFFILLSCILFAITTYFQIITIDKRIHPFFMSVSLLYLIFTFFYLYLEAKLKSICEPMSENKVLDIFVPYSIFCRGSKANLNLL